MLVGVRLTYFKPRGRGCQNRRGEIAPLSDFQAPGAPGGTRGRTDRSVELLLPQREGALGENPHREVDVSACARVVLARGDGGRMCFEVAFCDGKGEGTPIWHARTRP